MSKFPISPFFSACFSFRLTVYLTCCRPFVNTSIGILAFALKLALALPLEPVFHPILNMYNRSCKTGQGEGICDFTVLDSFVVVLPITFVQSICSTLLKSLSFLKLSALALVNNINGQVVARKNWSGLARTINDNRTWEKFLWNHYWESLILLQLP